MSSACVPPCSGPATPRPLVGRPARPTGSRACARTSRDRRPARARHERAVIHHRRDRRSLMIRHVPGSAGDRCRSDARCARGELDARRSRSRVRTRGAVGSRRCPRCGVPRPLRRRGRPGVAPMRALLDQLDPKHPGTLDARGDHPPPPRRPRHHRLRPRVPARLERTNLPLRLRVPRQRTILETNGRRWHDDPADYEDDHEKWSVPGRHDYRIVFATWDKVTKRPTDLLELERSASSRPKSDASDAQSRSCRAVNDDWTGLRIR